MHADSSNFAAGVGKKEAYEQVIEQAAALFDGQRNWVRFLSFSLNRTENIFGLMLTFRYRFGKFTVFDWYLQEGNADVKQSY